MSRVVRVIVGAIALSIVCSGVALADDPPTGDHHDLATETPPAASSADAAALAAQRALARAVAVYATTGVWSAVVNPLVPHMAGAAAPDMICGTCGGGNPPPDSEILPLYARRQINDDNCGPASGQVVINYTRDYFYTNTTNAGAEDTSINWKKQSRIATWMGTDSTGTSGWQIRNGLMHTDSNGVLNGIDPPAGFPGYHYEVLGEGAADGAEFHSWIVTDVGQWHMPIVPDLKPHKADAAYFLPTWPGEFPSAVHWVAIGGYDGFWDGTTGPTVWYTESSGWVDNHYKVGYWPTSALTMWKVTQYLTSRAVW
jgi:hypothetical protein